MPPVATKRIRNLKSAAAAAAAAMQNQNSRLGKAGDETRHQLQHSNRKIRMAHLINGSLVQPNQPPGSDLMRSGMQIHIYNGIDKPTGRTDLLLAPVAAIAGGAVAQPAGKSHMQQQPATHATHPFKAN